MRQSWAIVRAPWKAAPRVGGVDTRSGGFSGDVGTTQYLPIEDIGRLPKGKKKDKNIMRRWSSFHGDIDVFEQTHHQEKLDVLPLLRKRKKKQQIPLHPKHVPTITLLTQTQQDPK